MANIKQDVYRAEFALRDVLARAGLAPTIQMFGSTIVIPQERRFGSIEAVQQYVNRVQALNWIGKSYNVFPVKVRQRKGEQFAHYNFGEMAIPIGSGWALRELVVLHELSHHFALGDGHNEQFVGVFYHLINDIIGEEAGFMFRVFCDDYGVKMS